MIRLGIDPSQVPNDLPLAEHHTARLQLQQEYQAYRHSLTSAETLQLRVPLPGDRRYRLVDTYIATEVVEMGAAKAFIRTDTEHTWFGQGFSLMAIYRPLVNPGEDITISTNPSSGIYLKQLWQSLEALENQRWGDDRPRDKPRDDLKSYPDSKDGIRPAPNQPWWDGKGNYMLVATPKSLGAQYENQPGSKLSWEDVREQFWACYNPAAALRFKPWETTSNLSGPALHTIPPTVEGDKRLLPVRWDQSNSELLVLTPTLQRYLAACAAKAYPNGVPLDALPDLSTFDVLNLPGGFAVIHCGGVLLVDDWSRTPLDIAACQKQFELLYRRLKTIQRINKETSQQITELREALDKGRTLRYRDMVQKLSRQRLQLHTVLFETAAHSEDGDVDVDVDVHVLNFRALLEKRWGLSSQLTDLQSTLEQLDTLVRNHLELRTSGLVNALTIYGFPIALIASIFSDNILQSWDKNNSWLDGIHWPAVWISVGLRIALTVLLKALDSPTIPNML